jgi:HSP20 family molecular chaperone IbpA
MTTTTTALKRTRQRTQVPRIYTPRIDLLSNDDAVLLTADLPGVPTDGLTVEVDRGVLRLEGRRSDTLLYRRTLRLPDGLDTEAITANLANGVLTVTLPRKESAKPRRIEISSG